MGNREQEVHSHGTRSLRPLQIETLSQRSHSLSLCIPHFSRNRRAQSAGIDNEPWFGIWYSIIVGRFPSEIETTGKRPASDKEDTTMSEEKKTEVTEEVKEARKLSVEELEQVNGGAAGPKVEGVIGSASAAGIILKIFDE